MPNQPVKRYSGVLMAADSPAGTITLKVSAEMFAAGSVVTGKVYVISCVQDTDTLETRCAELEAENDRLKIEWGNETREQAEMIARLEKTIEDRDIQLGDLDEYKETLETRCAELGRKVHYWRHVAWVYRDTVRELEAETTRLRKFIGGPAAALRNCIADDEHRRDCADKALPVFDNAYAALKRSE